MAVTSVRGSRLDDACDMSVHLPLERELCPWGLAPVTSAATQMLFGDTVAIALMQARTTLHACAHCAAAQQAQTPMAMLLCISSHGVPLLNDSTSWL